MQVAPGFTLESSSMADREEKKAAVKALKETMKPSSKVADPDTKAETDEDGIPFHSLGERAEAVLVGVVDGVMRWPLWSGKLAKMPDGTAYPKIVQVPVAEGINGGQGAAFYKNKKGFKDVTAIPDKYAKFRDPYVKALKEYAQQQKEAEKLREQLARAGVTTTKTAKGAAGGR